MSKVVEFQYDLFESHSERVLRLRIEESEALAKTTKISLDRVRKGSYARMNELSTQIEELSRRLDIIEKAICAKS